MQRWTCGRGLVTCVLQWRAFSTSACRQARPRGTSISARLAVFCASLILGTSASAQTVLRVRATAAPGGDGSSWTAAFTHLQDALAAARATATSANPVSIWIASGTYFPDRSAATPLGSRDVAARFELAPNITIAGGFIGTELAIDERPAVSDLGFATILSGDLASDGATTPNSVTVLWTGPTAGPVAIDRVTVTGAGGTTSSAVAIQSTNTSLTDSRIVLNAGTGVSIVTPNTYGLGFAVTITGCSVADNGQRGIYLEDATRIQDCLIEANVGRGIFAAGGLYVLETDIFDNLGGGVEVQSASGATIINTRLVGNGPAIEGGAVRFQVGSNSGVGCNPITSVDLINCEVNGNLAQYGGGVYAVNLGRINLFNCTVVHNAATLLGDGGAAFCYGSTAAWNSIIQNAFAVRVGSSSCPCTGHFACNNANSNDGPPCTTNGSSITGPVLFEDQDGPDNIPGTRDDDLRLKSGSTGAINRGSVAANWCSPTPDMSSCQTATYSPDLAGRARVNNGVPDLGAYEFYADPVVVERLWTALSGQFNNGGNWAGGIAPGAFDRAIFRITGAGVPLQVLFPDLASGQGHNVHQIAVDSTRQLFFTVVDEDIVIQQRSTAPTGLIVGDQAAATVNLTNIGFGNEQRGAVTPEVRVGRGAASNGSLLVGTAVQFSDGVNTRLSVGASTVIGDLGRGTLRVLNGADSTHSGTFTVGASSGAVGLMEASGTGSSVSVAGLSPNARATVTVGQSGTGTLRVENGASFDATTNLGLFEVGSANSSTGSVIVTGSSSSLNVVAPRIVIGATGAANVSVLDGGLLSTRSLAGLEVASATGSSAVIQVRGSGSRWVETGGLATIGGEGTVDLQVVDGGEVAGIVALDRGAQLRGDGVVSGSLFNFGVVRPESASRAGATLTVNGDYTQIGAAPGGSTESGRLILALDAGVATGAARLAVTGEAALGGGLIVERVGAGTTPARGAAPIPILTADGGVTGFFDVAFLPPTGDPGTFFRAQPAIDQSGLLSAGRGPVNTAVVLTAEQLASLINTAAASSNNLNGTPAAAVTGDIDGINGPDVAVAIPNATDPAAIAGDLVVLLNQGGGPGNWQGWTAVQYSGAVGRNPAGIAVGNFDGQPGLDVAVSDNTDATVSILRNNGGGQLLPRTTFAVGAGPRGLVATDLDGDGLADVATANESAGTISVLRNQGAPGGTWLGLGQSIGDQRIDLTADATSLIPAPVAIAAANVNAEAGAELAVANRGASSVTIFRNVPSAGWNARWFHVPVRIPVTRPPTTVQPADLDDDKWEDFVTASTTGGTLGVVLNDRQFTDPVAELKFRPEVELPAGGTPTSVAAVDLDGDGDRDLVVAAQNQQAQRVVRVFRNDLPVDGQITLSPDQDIAAVADPQLVLAADLDGDNAGNPDDLVLVGGGGGSFSPESASSEDERIAQAVGGNEIGRGPSPTSATRAVLTTAPAPPPCVGDSNGDRAVNFSDITSVLANFGSVYPPPGTGPGDADVDGAVRFSDITTVLANFGATCPSPRRTP